MKSMHLASVLPRLATLGRCENTSKALSDISRPYVAPYDGFRTPAARACRSTVAAGIRNPSRSLEKSLPLSGRSQLAAMIQHGSVIQRLRLPARLAKVTREREDLPSYAP